MEQKTTYREAPRTAAKSARPAGIDWLRIAAHLLALIPFAWLLWDFAIDNLTANPIQALEQRTGYWAIVALSASLACTPLSLLFGWKKLLPLRRPLGLYGFFYATLHVVTFFYLDYGLDVGLIWADVATKRYILVGLTAFLLLLPLAFTSTRASMRRLGKRWKQLHRLIYVIAPLVVIHWIWSVKADYRLPALFGALVVLLLALRVPAVKRVISTWRAR